MHRHSTCWVLMQTTQVRTWNKQEHGCIKLPEQWKKIVREDKQELKTREQKKKAKDAKRIRGIVHENDKSKRANHVQEEMEKPIHHDEQALLSLWQGW